MTTLHFTVLQYNAVHYCTVFGHTGPELKSLYVCEVVLKVLCPNYSAFIKSLLEHPVFSSMSFSCFAENQNQINCPLSIIPGYQLYPVPYLRPYVSCLCWHTDTLTHWHTEKSLLSLLTLSYNTLQKLFHLYLFFPKCFTTEFLFQISAWFESYVHASYKSLAKVILQRRVETEHIRNIQFKIR